jgi:eukaryotic-like serine/threonine-protein kinase
VSEPQALIAGRYRLVRLVGSGGMGAVWEAWDERLERRVALKQLHHQSGLSRTDAELANLRAMREARITARLHHPHAVPVFDVVEHEGQACLIMQFIPSLTLSAVLAEGGPLEPEEAAQVGGQIAGALAAAHALGIVHRDVKPGNILIAEDGTALISDFGISRALGDATLTTSGMVHGTPAFLAPEVARGEASDFASDVFSLGATLYAALEGTPPFGRDENSIALLHRVAAGHIEPPQRSGALTSAIVQMLSADPESRPPMHAVSHIFAQLTAAAGGSARNISKQGLPPAEPPERQGSGAVTRSETVAPAASTAVAQDQTPATTGGIPPTATVAGAAAAAPAQDQPSMTTGGSPPTETGSPADGTAAAQDQPTTTGGSPPSATVAASSAAAQDQSPTTTGGNEDQSLPATATGDGRITPRPQRRYRAGVAAVALVAVLGVGILIAALLPRLGREADPQAGSGQTTALASASAPSRRSDTPSPTRTTKPSLSGSPRSSARPPSLVPTRKATAAPTVKGAPTAADLRKAITSYYALMPGNTDQAWPRMTASYQANHAGGRQAYERFWDAIGRVVVSDVSGSPPGSAQATLTYYFKDGRVVTERTAYGLVNDGGDLKINSSSVLSSTTT